MEEKTVCRPGVVSNAALHALYEILTQFFRLSQTGIIVIGWESFKLWAVE
jgi:hypothetical protein